MFHIWNASSDDVAAVRTGCASAHASINALATGYRCSGSIVLLLSIFNVPQWSLALLNLHSEDTVRRSKKGRKDDKSQQRWKAGQRFGGGGGGVLIGVS